MCYYRVAGFCYHPPADYSDFDQSCQLLAPPTSSSSAAAVESMQSSAKKTATAN